MILLSLSRDLLTACLKESLYKLFAASLLISIVCKEKAVRSFAATPLCFVFCAVFYSDIIYLSADESAFAPSAAAVITCLSGVVRTSPAAKKPSAEVTPSSPALM